MIIYNVTTKLDAAIADEWLAWLKNEHIPEVTGTGCFSHAMILRLIDTGDDEGVTFAIQYHAANRELYDRYITQHAPTMRRKATDKWGNQFIAFRTVMEVVD